MELATKFDTSDSPDFDNEPTQDRGVYPVGSERLLDLQRRLALCSPDELRAFTVLMDKLEAGRAGKPPLDLANDQRNWRHEARMELADACWYLFFDSLRSAP